MQSLPKTCRERTRASVLNEMERELDYAESLCGKIDRDGLAAHIEPFNQSLKRLLMLAQECARRRFLPLRKL